MHAVVGHANYVSDCWSLGDQANLICDEYTYYGSRRFLAGAHKNVSSLIWTTRLATLLN
jgi:hypothetical protein